MLNLLVLIFLNELSFDSSLNISLACAFLLLEFGNDVNKG